ncbi:MAG: hypothetical protein GY810_14740 [Aureispira sp.]|nr:hypothetical protein [Aureispira sp.]
MKNVFYSTLLLILTAGLLTSCGAGSEANHLIGEWELELVNGEAAPATLQATFEFKEDGTAIRNFGEEKTTTKWAIEEKKEEKTRFLKITDEGVDEQLEIKKLDATTLILLDKDEEITLTKKK